MHQLESPEDLLIPITTPMWSESEESFDECEVGLIEYEIMASVEHTTPPCYPHSPGSVGDMSDDSSGKKGSTNPKRIYTSYCISLNIRGDLIFALSAVNVSTANSRKPWIFVSILHNGITTKRINKCKFITNNTRCISDHFRQLLAAVPFTTIHIYYHRIRIKTCRS